MPWRRTSPREIPIPEIAAQLAELGVAEGGVLLVHTSFRAPRPVQGGPLTRRRPGASTRLSQPRADALPHPLFMLSETIERLARFARRYYDALIKQGFSKEEALQIVAGAGIVGVKAPR